MPDKKSCDICANHYRHRDEPFPLHKSNPISIIIEHCKNHRTYCCCSNESSKSSFRLPYSKSFMIVKEIRVVFYFFSLFSSYHHLEIFLTREEGIYLIQAPLFLFSKCIVEVQVFNVIPSLTLSHIILY